MTSRKKGSMEELSHLSLNIEEASALYIILETALDTFKSKEKLLREINSLKNEDRPQELRDDKVFNEVYTMNAALQLDALKFKKEVSEIIKELSKDKPKGIIKTRFGG